MPLCMCLDETAVSFLGIFLGLLGTVGMLKGQMNFMMLKGEDGNYKPHVEVEDDPKIIERNRSIYNYGLWLLLIGFIVQLLAVLL